MGQQSIFGSERRNPLPRMIGFRNATLQGSRTPSQSIVIRDLSPTGLGARAESKAPGFGETVVVTIDSLGEFKAMVKWVSRDLFGLHFASSLSSDQLDCLLGLLGQTRTVGADAETARKRPAKRRGAKMLEAAAA